MKLLRRASGQESSPAETAKEHPRLHQTIDAGAIRTAVAASLPLLQQSGHKLTRTKRCITCHQTSLVAMTVGLARRRGFAVNEDLASQARSQVMTLLGAKVPRLLLGADLDPTLAPYTLVGMADEDQKPNPLTDAIVHYLALRQKTDGRWQAEVYRPPEDASDFMFTALAVRGLQVYAPKGRSQEIAGRIARARSWLLAARPAETVDRVFQLLGLRWADAGAEPIQRAAAESAVRAHRGRRLWSVAVASTFSLRGVVLYDHACMAADRFSFVTAGRRSHSSPPSLTTHVRNRHDTILVAGMKGVQLILPLACLRSQGDWQVGRL